MPSARRRTVEQPKPATPPENTASTAHDRPRFGAHMSIAGGHDRAAIAANAVGFNTLQLFTKSNNQWAAKPLTDDQVRAFRSSLDQFGLATPVVHNSYLINLASPDDALWNKSIDALVVEIERAEALGIPDLVGHPGAHMGSGEEAGLARIAAALDETFRRTRGTNVTFDLESTAGQGSCLGHRLEHLARIIDLAREPERLGICLDTCHLFAAGYSLANPDDYNETIGTLDRLAGHRRVRVWHLNDSAKEQGSRVDRHAGLGRGHMGLEPFRMVVNDPRFAEVPMILETPKGIEDGMDLDSINLEILRRLRREGAPATRAPGSDDEADGRRGEDARAARG